MSSVNDRSYRIAIVGGGISGIVCAHLLQRKHQVTLFEKNNYLGGHTNTRVINRGPDAGVAVDTGFIVLNNKNYPNFHSFLSSLGVSVRWGDMSFGYYDEESKLQYCGTSLSGLFAQRGNILSKDFWMLLWGIAQFCQKAGECLDRNELHGMTLGEFLRMRGCATSTIRHYIAPMGAAIWSCAPNNILEFPAESFVRFFRNHGLLSFVDRPYWQTVVGGSFSYVQRFVSTFRGAVRSAASVRTVLRDESGAAVVGENNEVERFDKVIFASHADETLRMIAEPTNDEQRLLGAWKYSTNETVLHTDTTVLPPLQRAWASWNFCRRHGSGSEAPVSVSYHMNKLQGLRTREQYIVSLNERQIRDEKVHYAVSYTHPLFDFAAIKTQSQLPLLNDKNNSYFCGAYFGNGFHEDGVKSALSVCKFFGQSL